MHTYFNLNEVESNEQENLIKDLHLLQIWLDPIYNYYVLL